MRKGLIIMNVGERIIELRTARGITTNKLANMAGVSQSHLREIELGKRNPTVETLSFFCDALGVSLADFFSDAESGTVNPLLLTAVKNLTESQQLKLADFINSFI